MAQKWTIRRPPIRLYTSWDGDNLAELEAAWPTWTFTVNLNGTLHARSESGEFTGDLPVGMWFTYDAAYDSGDPTLGVEVQEIDEPGPSGLISFTITNDD